MSLTFGRNGLIIEMSPFNVVQHNFFVLSARTVYTNQAIAKPPTNRSFTRRAKLCDTLSGDNRKVRGLFYLREVG